MEKQKFLSVFIEYLLNRCVDVLCEFPFCDCMQTKAERALMKWIEGVNAGDLDSVLAMYAESAVLLPTFSSEVRGTLETIQDYFLNLAKNDRIEVELDQDSKLVQQISETVVSLAGLYTWRIVKGDSVNTFVARYSF